MYYDLSDIKVGKKTPLTLVHFEEFFRLLPNRADSERSWTIDFAARLQAALAQAQPFRERAAGFTALAKNLEDEFFALRKAKAPRDEIQLVQERWKNALRDAREADAKGTGIENAVYDLKAVNPHRVIEEDTRTPLEILQAIEERGKRRQPHCHGSRSCSPATILHCPPVNPPSIPKGLAAAEKGIGVALE